MSNILRQGSTGVKFDITIKENGIAVDLSSLTQKNYWISKPDGTVMVKGASFITTGIDGKLRYISVGGDLDQIGLYKLQADLIFPGGYDGPSDIGTFYVEANLQ